MKRTNHIHGFCLLMFCLIISSCSVKRPDNVFTNDKMAEIIYDLHLAKAMGEDLSYSDSYKKILYAESVYKKHGITKMDFDSSMVWFARNPQAMCDIYTIINKRLSSEKQNIEDLIALRDNKPKESVAGDSIDVWVDRKTYLITESPLSNKLSFNIYADPHYEERDTLRWNIKTLFVGNVPDSLYSPIMALQLVYQNDSVLNSYIRIVANGMQTLSLSSDTLGAIKNIRGFIYMPQANNTNLLIDSISLMRYHATDTLFIQNTINGGEYKIDDVNTTEKDTGINLLQEQELPKNKINKEKQNNSNSKIREIKRPNPDTKNIEKNSSNLIDRVPNQPSIGNKVSTQKLDKSNQRVVSLSRNEQK